jgi:hypothetical protein
VAQYLVVELRRERHLILKIVWEEALIGIAGVPEPYMLDKVNLAPSITRAFQWQSTPNGTPYRM